MWSIYKKSAALQVSLIRATVELSSKFKNVLSGGCIFLEMAQAVPGKEKEYDWSKDKKVNFAIATNDYFLLYKAIQDSRKMNPETKQAMGIDLRIMHDPGAGSDKKGQLIKYLTLKSATDPKYAGTYVMGVTYSTGQKGQISMSSGEFYFFVRYLEDNQNAILGEENFVVENSSEPQ